jgi:lactoylglutathione lyase
MKLLGKRDYPTGKFTLAFAGYGDESSNTVIELTHNWGQAERYNLGSAFGHLAVGVPDVYKTCERVAAAGVKVPPGTALSKRPHPRLERTDRERGLRPRPADAG